MVPKLDDIFLIVKKMHNEIGHFSEARTFVEVIKWFFWHERTHSVNEFVKVCDRCQLAKWINNMRSRMEGMNNIPMCDLLY